MRHWQEFLRGKLKLSEPLARHTSLKIGGPAEFWIEPKDLSDLQNLLRFVHKANIPLRVIGAGSNILADDAGIKGIVLRLSSPYFKRVVVKPSAGGARARQGRRKRASNQWIISAGAGVSLPRLLSAACENSLSAFELLAGIPGTVGGSLIMNAGDIGNHVLDISLIDRRGQIKKVSRKQAQFSYRSSGLNRYIILSANFKLFKTDKMAIRKKVNAYLNYRRKTQDLCLHSAGCFFKNPATRPSAGYFIERCGLKGYSSGAAGVSLKHANFIINKQGASSADILRLAAYITRQVREKYNLRLEPEVKIWR